MSTQIGPLTIAASADDASELATTVVSITANPLANCDTTGVWNAWRWLGITIPAKAHIVSCTLTIKFTSSTLDEPDVTFYGLDVATPAAFVASNGDISGRARTTASVNWSNTNAGTNDVTTSNLAAIIQELVDSYAPYSSGVIGLAMTTRAGDATRDTSVTSYDGSTTLNARLTIVYDPPSIGTLSVTLGAITKTIAGKVRVKSSLTKTLGAITISAAGTVKTIAHGVLSKTLDSISIVSSGKIRIGGILSKALNAISIASSGKVSISGVFSKTLDAITDISAGKVKVQGRLVKEFGSVTLISTVQVCFSYR